MNNKHHAGINQVQKCMNLMCSRILWRGKLDSMSFYASICCVFWVFLRCVFECFYPFTKKNLYQFQVYHKKKKPNKNWMHDLPYKELEEPKIDYLLVSIY